MRGVKKFNGVLREVGLENRWGEERDPDLTDGFKQ